MEDTALTPFKELLRYLYTGRMNLDDYEPSMISEIRQLAERFEMSDLVSLLVEQESIQITCDNVLKLLTESTIDSLTGKLCLNFIANNTQEVLYQDEFYNLPDSYVYAIFSRDDLSVSEQVIFEAVKRYISGIFFLLKNFFIKDFFELNAY
jgi:BTB/POZ domain-containing protein 9